jgi:hypothetical protein
MAAGEMPLGISEPGKLPAERFSSHTEVSNLCNQMVSSDRKRNIERANIEGLWGGRPVWKLEYLKRKGQGWRARVNHRGLEGVCQTTETAIYNLDTEVKDSISLIVDMPGVSRAQCRKWERSIARRFTKMVLSQWEDYDFHVQRRIHEMILHGMGYHFYAVKGHWIPRTPPSGCILFPDDCPLNFNEDGEFFMARDFRTAAQLYGYIRNEEAARKLGWNPDAVWKYMAVTSKSREGLTDDPQQIQRLVKQGDQGFSTTRQSGGWLNYLYVKEFDDEKRNGISLYVVGENQDVGDYLFKKRYYLDEWPIKFFPYDIGSGTVQSVRGLGTRMKDYFELENRLKNAMADQVMAGATMPVKQTVANIDPDKLKLMKVGLFSIIPQGLEPTNWQLPGLAQGPLALLQNLKQGNMENNQSYLPQEPERQDRQTMGEYYSRAQNIGQVAKGQHNLYYRMLTADYKFKFNTAKGPQTGNSLSARLARDFREGCARDGVPDEAFDHIEEIAAVRSVGAGSAAMRYQALTQLFQFVYPNASEDKKINLEEDLAACLVGYAQAGDYARSPDDNDIPDSDDSLAVAENGVLASGQQALAASSQDHVRHAGRHLQKGQEIQQGIQQDSSQGTAQLLATLKAISDHAFQHVQFLANNPLKKKEFAMLQKAGNDLHQFTIHLESVLQEKAAAQQQHGTPEQQLSEDGRAKMAKVQGDLKIKQFKTEQETNMKWQKLGADTKMNDARTASTIRRANQPAAA